MIYNINQEIIVDCNKLKIIGNIAINKSIDQIGDTAEITIANVRAKDVAKYASFFKRGQEVSIKVGYNTKLNLVFKGFVQKIDLSEVLKISCEDGMFKFRAYVPNKYNWNGATKRQSDKVTLTQILQYVIKETGCKYILENRMGNEAWYDKYTITAHATGLQVLEDLKNDGFINLYIKDDKLIADFKYNVKQSTKSVDLHFDRNVEKSSLEYLDKFTLNKKIIYEANPIVSGKKTIRIQGEAGDGNDIVRIKSMRNLSQAQANSEAQRLYEYYAYSGLRGTMTLWLLPQIEPLDAVVLHDYDGSVIKGKYLINSVKTTVDSSGGRQELTINRKIA